MIVEFLEFVGVSFGFLFIKFQPLKAWHFLYLVTERCMTTPGGATFSSKTPLHYLCDTSLGWTYPCYYVALQSAVIGISLGLTGMPPSSWDKQCSDMHHMLIVQSAPSLLYMVSVK